MRAGTLPRFRPVSFHAPPNSRFRQRSIYDRSRSHSVQRRYPHHGPSKPLARAAAVKATAFWPWATTKDVLRLANSKTTAVDLRGRVLIPGLNDSHLHLIRGGLSYNLELRREDVPSLADALRMLKAQAEPLRPRNGCA
ncbi:amidohydrolase family protein [Desulfovibrio porci]|uniref:amidohydrolase family protein n=1 Tax=Desulfovibrio porci TaxID=2605782 RepID=UPI003A8D8F52